jgi:hypothetical protein
MAETSLVKIVTSLENRVAQIPAIQKRAEVLAVNSDSDALGAASLRKEITTLEGDIEDARKLAVKPHNETVKAINDGAKELAAPLDAAKRAVKDKELAYAAKAEAERREQERKRAAIAEVAKTVENEQEKAAIIAVSQKVVVKEAPQVKGIRETVVFEITDAAKVPREFCEVSERLIRAAHDGKLEAVRAGLLQIPGVRFDIKKEIR